MRHDAELVLLKSLLSQLDQTTALDGSAGDPGTGEPGAWHPTDETLALFALGQLTGAERSAVVKHLAECVSCRRVAGHLLRDQAVAVTSRVTEILRGNRSFGSLARSRILWAAAACFVVAFGLWFVVAPGRRQVTERDVYRETDNLLVAGEFDEVQRALSKAAAQGIRSDRLLNIEAQALRGMRGKVALSLSGRLDQFGYSFDGTIARGPAKADDSDRVKAAYDRLTQSGTKDVEIALNRGHALLSLGRPGEAIAEFQRSTILAPENSLAWLGLGLARYMVDDFAGAERAFRRSRELDPNNMSAAVNLAMTLDEQGHRPESAVIWRQLLSSSLPNADKQKIKTLRLSRNSDVKP